MKNHTIRNQINEQSNFSLPSTIFHSKCNERIPSGIRGNGGLITQSDTKRYYSEELWARKCVNRKLNLKLNWINFGGIKGEQDLSRTKWRINLNLGLISIQIIISFGCAVLTSVSALRPSSSSNGCLKHLPQINLCSPPPEKVSKVTSHRHREWYPAVLPFSHSMILE